MTLPPLHDITNSQDAEAVLRKRTLTDYLEAGDAKPGCFAAVTKAGDILGGKENNSLETILPARPGSSPVKSSPGLTASGSSPLEGNSPSPNVTPKRPLSQASDGPSENPRSLTSVTVTTGLAGGEPPAKRKKLSKEEKEAKALADEAKRKEKEAIKAEKEAAKAKKAEEQARLEEEKRQKAEAKRLEKEEAEKRKNELKAQKAQKAAEKAKKEAEKLKKEEKQKRISSFFNTGPSTPKKSQPIVKIDKAEVEGATGTPSNSGKQAGSYYERLFKPFYLKENVTLAKNSVEMDEGTKEAKAKIFDEYMQGRREVPSKPVGEYMLDLLDIPFRRRRGRVYPSVKKIMAELSDDAPTKSADTTEARNAQIVHIREALRAVPVKSLKFREDVRPPYIGTISGLPPGLKSLRPVAKRPTAKIVPTLNYDYDSEAEWQEEDGEDVEDLDDEEDEADGDEDMDDFLDDSEDVGPARLVFSGGMEPENTGLCWQNDQRHVSPAKMFHFQMEIMLESLPDHAEIDPFSNSYWKPAARETPAISISAPEASLPSVSSQQEKKMDPPPNPSDAFKALGQKPAAGPKKAMQPLSAELLAKLKGLLQARPTHSKVGLIEWFSGEHPEVTKVQIKHSFELLTEKGEKAGRGKGWKLREDV
ncbi:chromatin assembly factor 1 subunit rlf2 [Echria macrotheca]|uniref:Chromatin assembly factor 1 subunit rlf2 n=1 Tax=Echria macrotheca TaxID=438768 RepID=A0AAJ0FHE3_9PEZI|nr:chromatin assembly factor 1 subunit rlf2 [Echria macrotheca]